MIDKWRLPREVEDVLEPLKPLGRDLVPVAAHGAVAGATFGAVMLASQAVCFSLRISAAVPLAPATLGLASVGAAAAAAGLASKQLDRVARTGRGATFQEMRRGDFWSDAAVDFAMGALAFKALGGRFRMALPSDVRYPGAFAKESIPAAGREYATDSQRRQLMSLYKRLGCHHCGTRRGRPIGDHMPPNKSAHGGTDGTYGPVNWQEPEEVLNRLLRQLPGGATRFPPPRQRYFPQCESCSSKQSHALRLNRRVLVMHFGGWNKSYVGALLPAVRHMGDHGSSRGWGWGGMGGRPWRWGNVVAAAERTQKRLVDKVWSPVQTVVERARRIKM